MSGLPNERSESAFVDFKPALTAQQALVEANRCLYCSDAPCIKACPTSINIPEFIRKISTGNLRGSARTILEANVFGSSCARVCPVEVLCVGDCVYNHMGVPPIQIGKLQRYATDTAVADGWEFFAAGADTGKSVGLIGGGPASLAAAHKLRQFGHQVTIYEARAILGGLNTYGIAPYKLRADRALDEVEWILQIGGIDVQTGVQIPQQFSWNFLLAKHDALFIGIGLGPDSVMDLPGGKLGGIHGAAEWIERMKLGQVETTGVKRAVVIGGGNTAVDAIRELRGLGVPHVSLVYRGTESAMSGYLHEWEEAKMEGAQGIWQTLPVSFQGDGTVRALTCVQMDDAKRPIVGTEHELAADLVLVAIGQAKLGDICEDLGVQLDRGRLAVDATGRTSHPKVFAGGDCVSGGQEVVNAVAEGRDAAISIHALLTQAGGNP